MDTMMLTAVGSQVIGQLKTLEYGEKVVIYRSLRDSLFKDRFSRLLRELRTDELFEDDITAAVEEVRQERYANGKQRI